MHAGGVSGGGGGYGEKKDILEVRRFFSLRIVQNRNYPFYGYTWLMLLLTYRCIKSFYNRLAQVNHPDGYLLIIYLPCQISVWT